MAIDEKKMYMFNSSISVDQSLSAVDDAILFTETANKRTSFSCLLIYPLDESAFSVTFSASSSLFIFSKLSKL